MLVILIYILSAVALIYYYWSRRHLYAAARNIKGSPGWPLIGNALLFAGPAEVTFQKINDLVAQVDHEPVKLWLGPFLLIILKNPEYLEKIMSSQKFAYKHQLYKIIEKVFGNGLISASGLHSNFKKHRLAIQPLFDQTFIEDTTKIYQNHINVCMDRFEKYADMQTFDIGDEIHKCMLDFNIEVMFGQKANYHDSAFKDFINGLSDMYKVGYERIVKVWLHPDFIYNQLSRGKRFNKMNKDLHFYAEEALIESWKRRKLFSSETKERKFVPIIDRLAEIKEQCPTLLTTQELVDHILTLFAAAEDPITLISSFGILCFGMYPEYQNKAVAEIRDIIGDDPNELSLRDLYRLNYLDMCVNEFLRLFPIAPMILRRMMDDYQLDKWIIPKGSAVLISIYNLHRDPLYWKNPQHFHPDHFLPEEVAKRHRYAHLAFSAGPRGCIGKNVAYIQVKQFLVNFLLKYEVEADGKVPDLKLKGDISIRSEDGYLCRIRKREHS